MTPHTLFWSIGFLALAIGSFTDIRTREVPDWVSYGLIFAAFAARLLAAFGMGNAEIFWNGLYGFGVFVALAYIMFYAGQWGGGDSKLLMGLGMIIGLELTWSSPLLGFWINMLLVGSVYGLLFSIYNAVRNRTAFAKEWKVQIEKLKRIHVAAIISSVLIAGVSLFIQDFVQKVMIIALALFIIGSVYLFAFIRTVEKSCMLKWVTPSQLTEGDWIVNDIVIDKERVTGPKDLGIEKEKIELLKRYEKKGKIKKVLIKEGIPFVPSFMIAFVIQWSWGSILQFLMF